MLIEWDLLVMAHLVLPLLVELLVKAIAQHELLLDESKLQRVLPSESLLVLQLDDPVR